MGLNWGQLHGNGAVDVANRCGTPVYAAASGLVTTALSGGWNDGYGSYIIINHGQGIQTLYAHLSSLFVSEGAYVNQGDLIAAIGKTGEVHGVTGCHLHFEVHGAANPFAR
jgi:murein DD-endopeptidase MepM/ murein hydrolase activator NlpD